MTQAFHLPSETRMIFLGREALTEGFRLIGFETWPDASPAVLETLLRELLDDRQSAFIVLDEKLARSESRLLERVRTDGGRIVVTEVPALHAPDDFHSELEDRVHKMFGHSLFQPGGKA